MARRRPPRPSVAFLLACAALAGGCAADRELRGAAAARSRGAEVPGGEGTAPEAGTGDGATAPARAYDPLLDDTRRLATVNGQVIALAQVRHDMGPSYDQYLDRREVLTGLVNKKVRDLVLRRIVAAEGKRLGMVISEEDMTRDEERQARSAAERGSTVDQMIQEFGMSRREWDDDRREKMLYFRSQYFFMGLFPDFAYDVDRFRPRVECWVSPAEIRAWGERHRADIDRPATATIRILYLCAEDFAVPGEGAEDAWSHCAAALDAFEQKLAAGEPFAAVADLGRRFPGTSAGGLHPPVTRGSGDLRSQYREWAFAEERTAGDISPRMKIPTGYVVLRLEAREDAGGTDIEEWSPLARSEIEALRRTMAWNNCQIGLLEEAAVAPAELKASLLAELRTEVRRVRRELDPPEPDQASVVKPR